MKWPPAPKSLSKTEAKAWAELGEALLVLGSVSVADLLMVARVAQVRAKVDVMLADARVKPNILGGLIRLEKELLIQLGLTPQARRAVSPLKARNGASKFDQVE